MGRLILCRRLEGWVVPLAQLQARSLCAPRAPVGGYQQPGPTRNMRDADEHELTAEPFRTAGPECLCSLCAAASVRVYGPVQ